MIGGSIRVIRLSGELDIGRRAEIESALQLEGTETAILIDAESVTYADSTAISTLLQFRNDAEKAETPVAIVATNRQFTRLIQYAGLAALFNIFSDRAAALTYLSTAGKRT